LQLVLIPDPDDLADAHRRIHVVCDGLRERFSRLELFGDYSGGTKAMSAALAMALVDQNAGLSLVAGNRSNLIRIDRSRGVRAMAVSDIRMRRLLQEQLPPLLERHLYDQASLLLGEVRQLHAENLDADSLDALTEFQSCLAVLMRWDRFEWSEALQSGVTTCMPEGFGALFAWWQRVDSAQALLFGEAPLVACTGYELVQDLILNADRRGRRGWYDDAVARLYRALELLAQTYIQLELQYNHLDFWEHPDIQRDSAEWRLRRGISGLYRWLRYREGDTGLGGAAARQWAVFKDLLETRNRSLLGHGLQPVLQRDWQSLQARVNDLVSSALQEAGCTQGPTPEQLPGTQLLHLPAAAILLGSSS
jgi:CRISPR-associated protein (TIGR02710 family)